MPRSPRWRRIAPRSRRSAPWRSASATASESAGSAEPLSAHPFLAEPGPIGFAHRGGAGDHPENSLEAFACAVRLGYRYLETDVHATSDGVLVAFHDDRLDRVTGSHGVVAELPWSEVAKARIDRRAPVPRLEELLDTWPEVRINIDPKHDAAVGPLLDLIEARGAADRVCIGAFSERRVEAARERFGVSGCTALTQREVLALWVRSRLGRPDARRLARAGSQRDARGGRCVQVPVSAGVFMVDRRLVQRAHAEGLPVHVWTVDDAAEMDRLLELGVDGLMSDRPMVLRDVLVRRGAWPGVGPVAAEPGTIAR